MKILSTAVQTESASANGFINVKLTPEQEIEFIMFSFKQNSDSRTLPSLTVSGDMYKGAKTDISMEISLSSGNPKANELSQLSGQIGVLGEVHARFEKDLIKAYQGDLKLSAEKLQKKIASDFSDLGLKIQVMQG